ncbi:aguA [Symbiodinium necroappetens]|uniref:AguA protein n=1 Tax=Symbiodinium necroappetens TaxID=1628268 RepID=A0A812NG98_9DINO|nr:aguA [Symbiodinium necroappetens]
MKPYLLAVAAAPLFGTLVGALFMPEEAAQQTRVYMSTATSNIWGTNTEAVQGALALLANTMARFQEVVIYVSPGDVAFMRTQLDTAVQIVEFQVDDLWMRDTSCIFVYSSCNNYTDCVGTYGQPVNHSWPSAPLSCVDFNFNGWGNKQAHANDAKVAAHVASFSGTTYVNSSLVMEGGSVEVDGEGTAIITRSSVINPNRNPGWTEADVENELYTTLGIEKVIWTDGIIGRDITDAHIDFYARFTSPGVVVAARENDETIYDYNVTRQVIADLQAATDARGRQLTVHILDNPSTLRPEWSSGIAGYAASYINYYVANAVVVAQNFGDSVTDAAATSKLRELYPGRTVESLNVDPIAFGGGGIHCSTQQQPVGITSPTSTTTVTTSLQDGSVPNKTERATTLAIVSMIFGLLLQPHFLTV